MSACWREMLPCSSVCVHSSALRPNECTGRLPVRRRSMMTPSSLYISSSMREAEGGGGVDQEGGCEE